MLSRSLNILVLLWSKTQLDRRAQSLCGQHFLDLKKLLWRKPTPSSSSSQKPELITDTPTNTHCYPFALSGCSHIPPVYRVCRGWWSGLNSLLIPSLLSLLLWPLKQLFCSSPSKPHLLLYSLFALPFFCLFPLSSTSSTLL